MGVCHTRENSRRILNMRNELHLVIAERMTNFHALTDVGRKTKIMNDVLMKFEELYCFLDWTNMTDKAGANEEESPANQI